MRRKRPGAGVVSSAIFFAFLAAIWIAFGPLQFGGQAAYVIINGNSMEPGFHRGDLVILSAADEYRVGDIVTYRHPQLGPVIHRIIAKEGARYVFKGDNNDWIDGYKPTKDELIGIFWLHIPGVGKLIDWLRQPWPMALLAGAIGFLLMTTGMGSSQQQIVPRRQNKGLPRVRVVFGRPSTARPENSVTSEPVRRESSLLRRSEDILFGLAILAVAAVALGVLSFIRPVTRMVASELSYEHAGTFRYSAAAPAGLYDGGAAVTGDPIFRHLADSVAFSFDYQLRVNVPATLAGTYQLNAEISDISGWKRTIVLQPARPFRGNAFTANGVLKLSEVQALIGSFEQQTNLKRSEYRLAIGPEIVIQGTLAGEQMQDTFAPRLTFHVDALQLQLAKRSESLSEVITPTKQGSITQNTIEQNTIDLLGFQLLVETARRITLVGLALALGGAAIVWSLSRTWQPDPSTLIQSKYAPLMITVRDFEQHPNDRIVRVASIDDLVKLAERDGRMILYDGRGSTERYLVQSEHVIYAYDAGPSNSQIVRRDGIEVLPQMQEITRIYDPVIDSWVKALNLRDYATNARNQQLADVTVEIAKKLGVQEPDLAYMRWGALLHDIGMLGISDAILHKPGPLSDSEWELMRQHPVYAFEMLSTIPSLRQAVEIPYCHHERWDGNGYPRGLKGEEIPLSARIFAVVDVWDSLRSNRPYRPGWSSDRIHAYLREQAGTLFDPRVVEAFLALDCSQSSSVDARS